MPAWTNGKKEQQYCGIADEVFLREEFMTEQEKRGLLATLTDEGPPLVNRKWANCWKAQYSEALSGLRNANGRITRLSRKLRGDGKGDVSDHRMEGMFCAHCGRAFCTQESLS